MRCQRLEQSRSSPSKEKDKNVSFSSKQRRISGPKSVEPHNCASDKRRDDRPRLSMSSLELGNENELVYEVYINGVNLTAFLDSGASHLFTSPNIAKQCGLTIDSSTHEEGELGDSSCVSTKSKATATLRIGDIASQEDIHFLDIKTPSDGI